jgi:hypothetical protein
MTTIGRFVVVIASLLPVAAVADIVPAGSGSTADPLFTEGVVENGFGTVFAGDVIVCDFGATCNDSASISSWSDLLVFYKLENGPYVTDASGDANRAYIFSKDVDLSTFLANYNTDERGRNGLSANHSFINEDVNGLVNFGAYQFNSPDGAVPEPRYVFMPLLFLLGTLCISRYRFARK